VTGASQGIGAGIVKAFVERGFNVVANSRKVTQSAEVAASNHVALVDGHIGEPATAAKVVETALSRFQSIDVLVNNAGIFFTKPFTDYTAEDFKALVATNVEGFLYVTQLAIKQMLAQKTGGSIVTITAALARNPIRGITAAVPMITKGGLETVTQHLAMEYARDGIRVNAVAPGAVYTPLHRNTPNEVMESLSPMGRPSTVKDITAAVMYLTDAATVTGEILYVDGGAHFGRWWWKGAFVMTVIQRVAICFAAGVLGALAVVLFSHVLFALGISETLGVKEPIAFKSPDIYRPLFWGGLWGIPFGLLVDAAWMHLYLFGFLYFLAPVLALFLVFLPMSGAGYFGLRQGGPMFTLYLLLVNLPFGIITALAARAIIGEKP